MSATVSLGASRFAVQQGLNGSGGSARQMVLAQVSSKRNDEAVVLATKSVSELNFDDNADFLGLHVH